MRKFVLFIISISSFLGLTGFGLFGSDLPDCKSSDTVSVLSQVINEAFKEDRLKFINNKNVKEEGFNKKEEIRVCSSDVLLSDGSKARIVYNIYWQNKKKDYFYVEIVSAEDY